MLLYHGTSEAAARAILRAGALQPRGKRHGNWAHTVKSSKEAVYLTDCYGPYFAINAVRLPDLNRKVPGLRGAVFEIETDRLPVWNMGCDEDAAAHSLQGHDDLPKEWNQRQRSAHYRKHILDFDWQSSLKVMGTCAHVGPIPIEAVTRIAYFDLKKQAHFTFWSLDPLIHPTNYNLVGAKYRRLTRWLFDADESRIEGLKPIQDALQDTHFPATREGIEVVALPLAAAA